MRFLSFKDKDARTNFADRNKSREEFEAPQIKHGPNPKKAHAGLVRTIKDSLDELGRTSMKIR